uniref:Uncharacterized protein n=1 Tax=Eubacterium cellulosolvens (strain ATCC 43171 / JCM 9499 / 6) TaxID=633697 RepID=I5AUG0_EUBC6
MAGGDNQKLKMLYLADIFRRYTDNENGLTCKEIIKKLEDCGVNVERKTFGEDYKLLNEYGFDIIKENKGRQIEYKLLNRSFELAELKLLVDSVQAAKFITDAKSDMLIKKLETLCSEHEAKQLQRQVFISGRVKTENKMVFNYVDLLHAAITEGVQVAFEYLQWDITGTLSPRPGRGSYQISPWGLLWDDEYYYLIAYDAKADMIKHYRVDKMKNLTKLEEPRLGQEAFRDFDIARYSKAVFGMFSGEITKVTLECENKMIGIIIDRFGTGINIYPTDKDHVKVHVDVIPSGQFLGWIMSLGQGVKIVGPEAVVQKMRSELKRMTEEYN